MSIYDVSAILYTKLSFLLVTSVLFNYSIIKSTNFKYCTPILSTVNEEAEPNICNCILKVSTRNSIYVWQNSNSKDDQLEILFSVCDGKIIHVIKLNVEIPLLSQETTLLCRMPVSFCHANQFVPLCVVHGPEFKPKLSIDFVTN